MAESPVNVVLTSSFDQIWPRMLVEMRASSTASRHCASSRVRSRTEPSSSPTTIGPVVSRIRCPGPALSPAHSTRQASRFSRPTSSASESWISPLPSDEKARTRPVATSGSSAARWNGALTPISPKS